MSGCLRGLAGCAALAAIHQGVVSFWPGNAVSRRVEVDDSPSDGVMKVVLSGPWLPRRPRFVPIRYLRNEVSMNSSPPQIPVQPAALEFDLPNLGKALGGKDAVKIVALGSSTMDGEGDVVAFP